MERFISLCEALFDEGAKNSVLLVAAIKESANMALAAQTAPSELHAMTFGFHISPHISLEMRRNDGWEADQMLTAINLRERTTTGEISRGNRANARGTYKSVKP